MGDTRTKSPAQFDGNPTGMGEGYRNNVGRST